MWVATESNPEVCLLAREVFILASQERNYGASHLPLYLPISPVGREGVEPSTSSLSEKRSTDELSAPRDII